MRSMQLLFAHGPHDEELRPVIAGEGGAKGLWRRVLSEQIINSMIVGGIVFITTLGPGQSLEWIPAAKGFGLTFLIEMRKYARLSG